MFEFENGLILYHGSYCEVPEPDLAMCDKQKDFGQGFYLTTSKEQAKSFLRTSIAKAAAVGKIENSQRYGFISVFELCNIQTLTVHIFRNTDVDWLHCIASHRKKNLFAKTQEKMSGYDVIVGKIANDATNTTLTAYIGGAFGEMGSAQADGFCIQRLLPNKLENQYCFRTKRALDSLKFIESEKIWLK